MPEAWLIVTRWLQLAPALVLLGAALFARYGLSAAPGISAPWLRPLLLACAAIALLATAGWLLAEAASFADDPQQPLAWSTLRVILLETRFGAFAVLRMLLLAAALLALLAAPTRRSLIWSAALAAAAVASFVGTGHGSSPGGTSGALHALADALHLWTAGVWLGALLPLCLLAFAGRDDARVDELARGLRRFSSIGPGVVAVLALTGVVNGAWLLGPTPWRALVASLYGRTLLLKLTLFAVMLLCAVVNRYVLTSQIGAARADARGRSLRRLRQILSVESAFGLGLIAVVAWLGALAPP